MPFMPRMPNKKRKEPQSGTRDGNPGVLLRVESHSIPCRLVDLRLEVNYLAMGFCTASPMTSSAVAVPQNVTVRLGDGHHTLALDGLEHAVPVDGGRAGNNAAGCGDSNIKTG